MSVRVLLLTSTEKPVTYLNSIAEGGDRGECWFQVGLDSGLKRQYQDVGSLLYMALFCWVDSSSVFAGRLEPLEAHSLCGSHLAGS